MNHWLVLISILLANDVEKNPGPLRSPEKRKTKLRRNKSVRDAMTVKDHLLCHLDAVAGLATRLEMSREGR